MNTFRFGPDDHSAREIIMKFGSPCFNCDADGIQYSYKGNEIEFHCTFEYKHPYLPNLDVKSIQVPRALARKLDLPLLVLSYFTKAGDPINPAPGDGYGTSEQPAMFYVIPGNKKAWKLITEFRAASPASPGQQQWFTPLRLAEFMHWLRGSTIPPDAAAKLSSMHRTYHRKTKVDVAGLMAAFATDAE